MTPLRIFYAEPAIDTTDLLIRGVGIREPMGPCVVDRPSTGDHLFMCWHEAVPVGTRQGLARLPAETLVVWQPGDHQRYGDPQRRWSHSWLHCDGRRLRQLLRDHQLPLNAPIALGDSGRFGELLLRLHAECTCAFGASPQLAGNLIENFVIDCARRLRGEAVGGVPPQLQEVRAFIDLHYHRPLSLGALAARSGWSVPQFAHRFRRHYGMAPIDYVIRLRMARAAYLLRDRQRPIAEVAAAVGYDDASWFSRLFRQHHGSSPRRWRQAQG